MVRFMTSVVLGVPAEHVLGRMAEKRYKPRGKSGSPSQKISYRESQLEMEEEDEVFVPYIEYPLGDCFFSVYLHFTIFENVIEHSVEVKIWKDAFQVRLLGASSHGRPAWARTVLHGPLICVAFSLEVMKTLSTDALTHLHGEQCSLVVERQPTTAGDYLSPPSTLYGPRAAWVRRWRETGPEAGAEVGAVEAEVEPEAEGGRRSPSRSASSLSSGASGESSGASEVMALRRAAPHARLQQTRFLAGVGDVSAATRKADRPEPFQRLFQQPTQVPDILVGEAIEDEEYMSVSTMLSEDPYYEAQSGRAMTSAFPSPSTAASLKLPSRLPSRVPSRVGSVASTGGTASAGATGSAGTTGAAGAAGTSAGPARGRGAHGAHGSHGAHVHIVPLVPHRLFCRRAIASFKVDFPISIGNKSVSQMSQKTQRSDVSSSRSTRLTRGTRPGSALSGASHDSGRSARATRATRATRITKASRGTVATREGGKAGNGANGGKAGKGGKGGKAGKGGKGVKGGKGGDKGHGAGGGPQNAGGARAHLDGLPLRLEGAANKFFTDMRAMFLEPVYEDDLGRGAKLTAKKVQLRAMVSASDLMDEMQKAQLNPLMVHVSAVFNLPVKILSLHGFEKVLVRLRLPEAPDAAVRTTPRPLAQTVRFDESFSALTAAIPPERLLSQLEHQRLAFEVVGLRPDNWRPQAAPVVFGAAAGDAQMGTRPPIGAAGSCARAEAGACGVRAAVRLPPPLHVVLAEAEVDAAPLAHGRNVLHFCQPLRITAAHYGEGPGTLWDIHKLMEDWLGIADTTSAPGNEPEHDLANEHLRTKADPPCQASPLTDGHFVESASYLQVEVGLVSDLRDAQSPAEGPRLTPASASTGGSGLGASRGESLESVAQDTGIQPLLAVLWDRAAAVRLAAAAYNVNQEALGAFPPVGPLSQLAPRDPDAQLLHRTLRLHQPELDSMSLSSLRRRLSRQTFPFADVDRRNVGGSRRGSNASETSCKLGYKREHEAALVAALAAAATAAAAAAAAAASASAAASAAEAQMQDSDENLSKDRQENLPPEPTISPSDAVSGFVIDGIDIFFIYIEAPGGRALQPFLQEGMRLRPEEGRLLYHSELRTPTRRYAAFLQLGGILSVATRSPLLEMLRKKPTALLRGHSRSGCWEALWRLDLLRRAKLLRPVLQSGLLPTPRALLGLLREHGVPLRPAASAERKDLAPPPTPGTERPPTPPAHAAARRVLQALWPDGPAVDGEGPEATDEENARRGFGRRGRIHAVAHVLGQLQGLRPGEQEGDEALAGARPGASARAGEGAGAWLGAGAGAAAAAAARASVGGRVGAGMGAGAGARVGAGSGSGAEAGAGAGAGAGTGAGQGRRVGGSSSTPLPAVGALARGPQPPKRPRLLCNRCKRTPPLAWILDAAAQAPRPPLPPSYKKGAFKSLYPTVSNIPSMMHTSDAEDLNMWLQRDEEEGEESPLDLKRKKKGKGSSSGKTDSTSVTTDSTKSKKYKGKKGGGKKKDRSDKSKLKDKSKDSGDSDKSKGKEKSDKLKKKDKSDKLEKKDLSDKTKGKELSDQSKDEDDNMKGEEKITDKDDSDKSKGRESSEKPEKESADTLKGKESLDKLKVKESSDELKDKEGSDKLKGKERSDKLKGIEHSDKSKDEDDAEKSKGKGLFDKTKGKEMSGSTLGEASSTTKKKSTVTIAPFGSESMGKSDTSDTDLGRKSSSSKKSSKSSITLRGSRIGSIRMSIAKTPKTRPLTKKVDSEVQTELTVLQKKKGSVMYTRVSQPQIGRRTLPPLRPRSSSKRASTLSSPRDRQRSLSRRSSKRVSTAYSRQSKDLANRRSRGASMRTAGGN